MIISIFTRELCKKLKLKIESLKELGEKLDYFNNKRN